MEATNYNQKFWLDRPVLVTGATGLVGGWLVKHLLSVQASVICLIRDQVPNCELLSSGNIDRVVRVQGELGKGLG